MDSNYRDVLDYLIAWLILTGVLLVVADFNETLALAVAFALLFAVAIRYYGNRQYRGISI